MVAYKRRGAAVRARWVLGEWGIYTMKWECGSRGAYNILNHPSRSHLGLFMALYPTEGAVHAAHGPQWGPGDVHMAHESVGRGPWS
jgi:hypothetical protein